MSYFYIVEDSWLYCRSSFAYFFSLLTLLAVWPRSFFLIYFLGVSQLYGCSSFYCFSLLTLLALWPQSIKSLIFLVDDSWLYGRSVKCTFSLKSFLAVLSSFSYLLFSNLAAIWRFCFFSFIAFLCLLSWPFRASNSRFHCKRLVAWAAALHSCTFLLLLAVWPMRFFMPWHFFRDITDSWSLAHKFKIELFFEMRKLFLCLCRWLLWTRILFSIGVVALSSQLFCFCLWLTSWLFSLFFIFVLFLGDSIFMMIDSYLKLSCSKFIFWSFLSDVAVCVCFHDSCR